MSYRAVIIGVLIVSPLILGQVLNGNFEIPDPNSPAYFVTPLNWDRIPHPDSSYQEDCYAGLYSSLSLSGMNWEISHPFQGDNFVLLHTGAFDRVGDSQTIGSIISQEIFLSPGDTITGTYFFGTTDYPNFNDYGSIYLKFAGDPNVYPDIDEYFMIPDTYCDVEAVGSFGSTQDLAPLTDGWVRFSYAVEPNQVGPYYLQCQVSDYGDTIYPSHYAIDNLQICAGGQSQADLNYDCNVNLEDYFIISQAWLAFCPDVFDPNIMDPNDIASPDIPCQLADIDNSWYVDPNDLLLMSEDWLY